jgi:protein deglycase
MSGTAGGRPHCALLLYADFAEYQIAPALEALRGRAHLTVLAQTCAPVRGEGGLRVLPDGTWHALAPTPALAILPGALDMGAPATDVALLDCLRRWGKAGATLAALCGGPVLLHSAGLLEHRRFTVGMTMAQRQQLGMVESRFVDAPVVRDGPVITARANAAEAFAAACLDALADKWPPGLS